MKKIILIALICAMLMTCAIGCAKTTDEMTADATAPKEDTKTEDTSTEDATEPQDETLSVLPLPVVDEPITITAFSNLPGDASFYGLYENLAESPTVMRIAEITGVNIDFTHPPIGQEVETFNLIVSSGDLPDMFFGFVQDNYEGGVESAVQDGVIADVEDLVMKYAPNFRRRILEDPDARKLAYTDNGFMLGFGAFFSVEYGYDDGLPYGGLFIRRDLLSSLGLEMPHTIDSWTETLRAFKESGISIPFAYSASGWNVLQGSHFFASAYDTAARNFFQIDGDTHYSKIEPGYKEYVSLLNQWYEEGLIDPDFLTHTFVDHTLPMMVDGTTAVGAVHLYVYMNSHEAMLENGFDFGPAPVPVQYEGQEVHIRDSYGFGGGGSPYCITADSEYKKELVMMIDFLYSEEGMMLTNWGIEGESYIIGDEGKPTLTDEMMDNYYELNVLYCPNEMNLMGSKEHDLFQYPLEVQHEAWDLWTDNAYDDWRLPPGYRFTVEEQSEQAEIMTEIETYADEMLAKFILGTEDIGNWDAYVAEIEDMGIQDVITIYNNAIERYNNR